ncbi:MAG: MFS transporter [Chloroflexi bacterium]|nr:MFS transporter [Chloroflexota bacterium]
MATGSAARPILAAPMVSVWGRAGLGDRDFATLALVNVVTGITQGMMLPVLPLWLTGPLGLDLATALYVMALFGLAAVAENLVAGRMIDRTGRPWLILQAGCVLGVARGVAFATLGSTPLIAAAGMATGLLPASPLFALLNGLMNRREQAGVRLPRQQLTSLIRAGFSLGWMIGAPVGTTLYALAGPSATFWAVTGLSVVAVLVAPLVEDLRVAPVRRSHEVGRPDRRLLLFGVAMMLALSADSARFRILPIQLVEGLHAPATMVGLAYSVGSFCMLPMLPLLARVADRVGVGPIVVIGALLNSVSIAALWLIGAPWLVLVLQVVSSPSGASIWGLGINMAQEIGRDRVGTATGIYFSAWAAASAVGPFFVGAIIGAVPLPLTFLPIAVLALGAGLLLVPLGSTHTRSQRWPP